jgi:ParB-like chromosome segregation protein Spo0J
MQVRSSEIEKHLENRLVKFDYLEKVPLTKIDEKRSLQNQARFEPLDEGTVARYAEAQERGDDFPAVLAAQAKGGQLVLLDGNHRYQSRKRAGLEDIDVYVVTATPEKLQLLTFEANALHGMPPSTEERQRHAIYLIDNGASHEAAAASVGLQSSSVRSAWNLERAERRARQLGITRGWNRLLKDQKERLAAITSDAGFVAAAKLVIDSRLNATETRKLTNSLRQLRSDRAQIEQIELVKEEMKDATVRPESDGPNRGWADARRACLPHLGYLISMDIEAIVNSTITFQQAEDLQRRIGDAAAALDLLSEGIKAKHAEDADSKED